MKVEFYAERKFIKILILVVSEANVRLFWFSYDKDFLIDYITCNPQKESMW